MPADPKPFLIGQAPQAVEKPELSSHLDETLVDSETSSQETGNARDSRPDDDAAKPNVEAADTRRLGADLARALQDRNYYPVVLFGTSNSGKTSLLLSLFSALVSEPSLQTGIFLCDPILGSANSVSRQLHAEAKHTFDVKTQAFIEGEKIPKTTLNLPFFIPVEVRPSGQPPVRFAFLESNGEWYRPNRARDRSLLGSDSLYQALRSEIEDFIATYQGGISFLYLIPYTQAEVYSDRDASIDTDEIANASLAIAGVLRAYDSIRASYREADRHLMLVTKWDAHSLKSANRAEEIEANPAVVEEFCSRRYQQALSAFKGLGLAENQRVMNAYCSGIINERGLLQPRQDDLRSAVRAYPVRLWTWLYSNALEATGLPSSSPFPTPPEPPLAVKAWRRVLEFVSGR